jgi:hypothetical protein
MPRDELDPAKIAEWAEHLDSDFTAQEYADELADNLKDSVDWARLGDRPPPDYLSPYLMVRYKEAAFRSERLAVKSLAACRLILGQIHVQLQRDAEQKPHWARSARLFQNTVGYERRILEQVVAGQRAMSGVLPSSPNPRARAMEALKESDCAHCGTHLTPQFLDILREEEAKAVERKRAQRDAMRAKAGKAPRRNPTAPNVRRGQQPGRPRPTA